MRWAKAAGDVSKSRRSDGANIAEPNGIHAGEKSCLGIPRSAPSDLMSLGRRAYAYLLRGGLTTVRAVADTAQTTVFDGLRRRCNDHHCAAVDQERHAEPGSGNEADPQRQTVTRRMEAKTPGSIAGTPASVIGSSAGRGWDAVDPTPAGHQSPSFGQARPQRARLPCGQAFVGPRQGRLPRTSEDHGARLRGVRTDRFVRCAELP